MNLAEHFFQDQYAFVTFAELENFCKRHAITDNLVKRRLLAALIKQMGGKEGSIQWNGKEKEKAILYVGLLDFSLWNDKLLFGKGVKIGEFA